MKKQICLFLSICLAFSLSGCFRTEIFPTITPDSTAGSQHSPTTNTEPNATEIMVAVSVPTITENATTEDGIIVFQYTYQTMSLVHNDPKVADKIILDFLNRVDSTRASAQSIADMALNANNGRPYVYHLTYSPLRIDYNVLSLFGNNIIYSGGGHPERTCVSASYDLLTGDVLTLASIMTKDATMDQLCDLVLAGLTEMAEGDYLYEDYANTVKKRFRVDASQDQDWYFTQTGLCFYFSPYEIAPYSSGVISVEIPYEKLNGLLHEAYFPADRATSTGDIKITPFENANLENFTDIAEFVANKDGDMYMAYAEGSVQDVRIQLKDFVSSFTVFAAYGLSKGDGIMIQANDETLKNMNISYKSKGETIVLPFN